MLPLPRIPGYELLTCFGGSLLTSVWNARRRADDTPCAVKVLNRDWQSDPTAVKLLQREARACLAVKHPHLVRLLDTHVTRSPYFLVMEMLEGDSLRHRLQREFRLGVRESLWVTRQAAEALAALHRAGFVHGDVKPENIRIGAGGHAFLIDLGFAHRIGENTDLLKQGYVLGTVNYLAPELCGPEPQDSFASDIFSLGVTLYEMLTGQMPYPAGSIEQTFRRHESDPPADLRQHLCEAIPPQLPRLLNRLLAQRLEDRPRAPMVAQHLIGLEIATMGARRAA